ncbi:MAG TPA: SGNH hydrolase domain-containing protein, partial [Afipia sp.]
LKKRLKVKDLFVIGSVPGTAAGISSVLDCVSRPWLSFKSSCEKSLIQDQPLAERAQINRLLDLKLPHDATFLNPFDALCTTDTCNMLIDGNPVYSDATHLTKFGSILVTNKFRERLLAAARLAKGDQIE